MPVSPWSVNDRARGAAKFTMPHRNCVNEFLMLSGERWKRYEFIRRGAVVQLEPGASHWVSREWITEETIGRAAVDTGGDRSRSSDHARPNLLRGAPFSRPAQSLRPPWRRSFTQFVADKSRNLVLSVPFDPLPFARIDIKKN